MSKNTWLAVAGISGLTVAVLALWWVTTQEDTNEPEVATPVTVSFLFDEDSEGWQPGFADYPSDPSQLDIYELDAGWRELPDSLGGGGLYGRGSNHSDDLMMYWIREIEDLVPTTAYDMEFELEIATNVPSGMVGIGGSPTDSSFLKVGASISEPTTEPDDLGFERLTIDMGSQSQDGTAGRVIGTLSNPNVDSEAPEPIPYALNVVDGTGLPVRATASDTGSLWVIVAVDSGFEGLTEIYHAAVEISLTPAE
ncbi:MAG: hypothetical protein GY926_12795 [bacterium]|nr:hypothetical protein [bacterium]